MFVNEDITTKKNLIFTFSHVKYMFAFCVVTNKKDLVNWKETAEQSTNEIQLSSTARWAGITFQSFCVQIIPVKKSESFQLSMIWLHNVGTTWTPYSTMHWFLRRKARGSTLHKYEIYLNKYFLFNQLRLKIDPKG